MLKTIITKLKRAALHMFWRKNQAWVENELAGSKRALS